MTILGDSSPPKNPPGISAQRVPETNERTDGRTDGQAGRAEAMSFSIETPYRATHRVRNKKLRSAHNGPLFMTPPERRPTRAGGRLLSQHRPMQNTTGGGGGSDTTRWLPASHTSDFLYSLGCSKMPVVKVAPESSSPEREAGAYVPQHSSVANTGALPQQALRTELKTWLEDYLGDTLQEHLKTLPHQLRVEVKTALREVERRGGTTNQQKPAADFVGETPEVTKERERRLLAERESKEEAERLLAVETSRARELERQLQEQSQLESANILNLEKCSRRKRPSCGPLGAPQNAADSHGANWGAWAAHPRERSEGRQTVGCGRIPEHEQALQQQLDERACERENHDAVMNELLQRKEAELQKTKEDAQRELRRQKQAADRQMEHMLHEKARACRSSCQQWRRRRSQEAVQGGGGEAGAGLGLRQCGGRPRGRGALQAAVHRGHGGEAGRESAPSAWRA